MQGRQTGSAEYLKAAAYVVDQFKADGLEPAGVNGTWYQPVHFDVQRVLADRSSLSLTANGQTTPLTLGEDAILGTRSPQPKTITAPLVFIGYGLHLPESNYDDFNSPELPMASLKGKIVVYINGGPADLPGPLKSFARTTPFLKAIRQAGAVGAIAIPTPKSMDFGWQRVASSASQPGMRLAATPDEAAVAARHPALANDHGTLFTATFNPAQADKLFAATGHTFADLLALADAQKPSPQRPPSSSPPTSPPNSPAPTPRSNPNTSSSPPISTTSASASPFTARPFMPVPWMTPPVSPPSSKSHAHSAPPRFDPSALSFSSSSPRKKKACSAPATTPATRRFRRAKSAPTSIWTCSCPSSR
jgi:hypothetical protein